MAVKRCEVCGAEFEGGGNERYCEGCKTQPCAVCGKPVEMTDYARAKLKRDGFVCCCAAHTRAMRPKAERDASKPYRSVGKTCALCGKEFEGGANSRYCDDCKVQPCAVCGRPVRLDAQKMSRFVEKGYATCGSAACAAEMRRRTSMEAYGVDNPSKTEAAKEKIRVVRASESDETKRLRSESLKRSCGSEEVKRKRRETSLERYGVESVLSLPEVHERAVEAAKSKSSKSKRRQTVIERYGVGNSYLIGWNNRHEGPSGLEVAFGNALSDEGIGYEREFFVCGKPFDFKIAGSDVLIELDPWIWHNATFHPFCKDGSLSCMKPSYHSQKSALAVKGGYRCIHVFDWDDWGKIVGLVKPPVERIGARECSIYSADKRFDEVNSFLEDFHIQGRTKSLSCAYYLSHEGRMVSAMTFGKPRYNKRFDWELLRYCVAPGVSISGGAARMLSHFREEHPGSIVSYCDRSKFDGGIYRSLGFELESKGKPTAHWYNPKTGRHITDSLLLRRGADQLLGTSHGKGTDNREIMVDEGFVEIYDCGQSRWALR